MRSARWPGSTSATISVMRASEPCSTPFARLMTGTSGAMQSRACSSTDRNPCDGTATTTTSASRHASSMRAVAWTPSGSGIPGRYSPFSWCSAIMAAIAGSRAHSTVGAFVATIAENAVPQEPAPTTAAFT
jgi:hypothetical protein